MSNDYLHQLRDFELQQVLRNLPPAVREGGEATRVLDLGAGTGRQAALLASLGYEVTAVDLASSAYASGRVYPVVEYDGEHLPLREASVDVVFSSNVLEHVGDLNQLLGETQRVLAPGGLAIHILPTSSWRIWTTLTHFPWLFCRGVSLLLGRAGLASEGLARHDAATRTHGWGLLRRLTAVLWPPRHGERGNAFTENWYFSEQWWRKTFTGCQFIVRETRPAGLFYTGSMLLAGRMPLGMRRRLATALGSSCRIYVLIPASQDAALGDSSGAGKQTY